MAMQYCSCNLSECKRAHEEAFEGKQGLVNTKNQRIDSAEDDVEIIGFTGLHSGGRRTPLTKSARSKEVRSEVVFLRYIPTGEEGQIEIPPGQYNKKEMQRLREATKAEFLRNILVSE